MRCNLSLLVAAGLLGVAGASYAQVQTGSILVKVTDEKGGTVPGVTVTITSPVLVAGQMTGTTDAGGAYRFPSLGPGTYSVKLARAGFQSVVRENVAVNVGATTPLEMSLKVAARAEEVTVTAESPVVDTTSANVNVTLDSTLLQRTPGGRDIWSLVEYKVPGAASARPDVGGAAGGLQGALAVRGTTNAQNTQMLNGINIGDPAAIGFAGFYYDYDAFDQIQVSTGAHDLSAPGPGIFLNMVTRTGGDKWRGQAKYFWQGDATQGRNVDQGLLDFGLREDAGATKVVSDANFQIGGPLLQNKLRLFTSFRDWRVHVNVPGFPETETTDMDSGMANLSYQVNPGNRLTAYGAYQTYRKPNRGAAATNMPLSDFNEDDHFTLLQGLWNSVLGQKAFLDARVSYLSIFFPLYQKGHDQSLFDQSTGFLDRAAQTESIFTRKRLQASVNFQYFVAHALGGRHELRFGIDHAHTPTTTAQHRIDDLNLFWRSATNTATQVQLFNSPVNSRATVDDTALFVQDTYILRRLTILAGARAERVEGYLPEQSSPPSQWFPGAPRTFPAIHDIPKWYTVAPRLSLAYDLKGDGRTAIKASAGRYYYVIGTGTPNSVNPNFTFSETYAWNDLNGDLHFQPNERGALLGRAGGLITSFDPNVKRPYTDELTVGIDHQLIPNLRLSVVGVWRRERDLTGNADIGVPFSAYTPVTRPDNGRDGVAGTADDTTITVYNQDPATLGRDLFVITNSPLLNQDYKGLEVTLVKRFSQRWQMVAGYTYAKGTIKAEAFASPNQLINSEGPNENVGQGRLDRTHTFKLSGSYLLPMDFEISSNFRVQTGPPITRTASFALNQGTVTVNAEALGSVRLDNQVTLDARIAKVFKLGGGRELEATADGYNLFNANTVWQVRTLTGRINVRQGGLATGAVVNQPQFLSPTGILGPRIFRLGLGFRF
jgi:carboxypeptidase family protein/TonB-dependent receptor-like protein